MENTRSCERNDILVNFRDLLLYVLTRWKSIVVCLVVLTVLLPTARYALDWKDYNQKKNATTVTKVELTDEEMAGVVEFETSTRMYEEQLQNLRRSLLMQINADKAPSATLSFLVKGVNAPVAAALYENNLDPASLVSAVDLQTWPNATGAYVQELISVFVTNDENIPGASLVTVDVVAPDEAMCQALATAVEQKMTALTTDITNSVGMTNLTVAGRVFSTVPQMAVKNTQQSTLTAIKNMKSNIESLEKELSSRQKAYLKTEDEAETNTIARPSVNKKYVVVGFAGGLFLPLAVYVLGYLMSKRIKSSEDITERLNVNLLATVSATGKEKDKWLRGLKPTVTNDDAAWTRQVALLAKQNLTEGKKSIALVEDAPLSNERYQALTDALKKVGFKLTVCADPLQDVVALDGLSNCAGVILSAAVGKTAYTDMYDRVDLCRRLNTPVLGMIVLY